MLWVFTGKEDKVEEEEGEETVSPVGSWRWERRERESGRRCRSEAQQRLNVNRRSLDLWTGSLPSYGDR